VQVYKYLTIGSGKLSENERRGIPHYLIDVAEPDYPFSAGDYQRLAYGACETIVMNGKVPFFVGGTGLYVDSFFQGLSDIPDVDPEIRKRIIEEIESAGLMALYRELGEIDRAFAEKIHYNDRQRIIRGLEVFRGTGKSLSQYYSETRGFGTEGVIFIGLFDEREIIRKNIDKRVDKMIRDGFIDEVLHIRSMGYGPELKSMKSIGYAEVNEYIDGSVSLEDMAEAIKTSTKRYAKRQMTWFRKNRKIMWFKKGNLEGIRKALSGNVLEKL